MKKMCKLLSMLLVITMILNFFVLSTYADDSLETQVNTLYKTGNYSTYYFYNLHENFGYNAAESCGYVAMGMLLSFYDVYWDSDFISDLYLKSEISTLPLDLSTESPGIVSDYGIANILDPLAPEEEGDPLAPYFNYVNTNSNSYFHFYLMKMGIDRGYVDSTGGGFGLFGDRLRTLLQIYLQYCISDIPLSNNVAVVNCTKASNAATISEIARLIDQGIPVLISGYGSAGAHAMIAYDYSVDESGDIELYVHLGYTNRPELTHVKFSSLGYDTMIEALYLDVTSDHQCSLSFNAGPGGTYCSCSFAIHPEHVHNYIYLPYNSTKHIKKCALCGSSSRVAHVVQVGGTRCVHCGERVSTDGPIQILSNRNNVNYVMDVGIAPAIVEYITNNGSYILSNGVIILSVIDMKAYINGELDLEQYG